jgi:hypothetical protein
LIASHAGLVLLDTLTQIDAPAWSGRNPVALSVAVGLVSALGLAVQGAQVRRRSDKEEGRWKMPKMRRKKRPPEPDTDELTPDMKALRDAFRKQA